MVVTGYTDTHVTMHDPLFGLWASRAAGSHFSMPNDLFAAGWGGFPSGENPNWVGLSIRKAGVSAPKPAPQPVPTPPVQPSPPPAPATPAAPASTKAGHRMDDEMRRIEALAAYRWAVAPDPDDEAALAIWREHLGDFGLEYDEYKVQSGDTLAGLAGRFFGEQHRWHAIKAYNRLEREGLWLGETLMIPRLGSSGAHENDALPSDSAEFAKAIAIDDIVDPDLPAQDYNALGAKSIGIGFAE